MEKFTEILNQCTGFLEGLRGNDQFVQLFGSVVRYLLPVLPAMLLPIAYFPIYGWIAGLFN